MTRNVLKTLGFIRSTFLVAAGIPFLTAVSAFAQDPAAPAPAGGGASAEVERVVVTGSNIPTAEEVGPNPVDTYRTEDIRRIGIRTTTDLVQKLPGVTGFSINQNIANGGDGRVEINLRGIFPKETLVLVDGRRIAPNLNGTSLGGTSVDIGPLPFELFDHVDILKDGASAVYGSDAVAGVFNVFFKHKYRGLEIGMSYGNTNAGASNDAAEKTAWLLAGTGDDKTDIVVFAKWEDRADIYSADRGITNNGNKARWGGDNAKSGSFPGRINNITFVPNSGMGPFGPNTPTPHAYANATAAATVGTEYQFRSDQNGAFNSSDRGSFNFARLTPSIPGGDKENLYASYTHDICDKYLTIYTDFMYTRSFFNAALAPVPFTPDPFVTNASGSPLSSAGISVPTQNAFSPFTVADTTIPASAGAPYAGLGVTTNVRYRGLGDVPRRFSKDTTTTYLIDVGFKGEMGWMGDYFKTWNWDADFRYNDVSYSNLFINAVSKPGLREALSDTNPDTAFNVFGIPSNPRQFDSSIPKGAAGAPFRNTFAARNRVFVTLHSTANTTLELEDWKLNGDLFKLPAGEVGFAVGVEHRRERYKSNPDSLNTTFSTIGSTDIQASKGNRDVWGTFQEVRIPITSPTWNVPYVLYNLEFTFAEREEWYATSVLGIPGGASNVSKRSQNDTQRPKFSIRWNPFDDSLTLRASYSEAFHVPYLNELSPQGAETFPASTINSTTGSYQPRGLSGGNPSLRPEVSYDWSYGAVWTPKYFVKGLTLAVEYWHIHERDLVSPLGFNFIAQNCEMFPGKVRFESGSTCSHDPGDLVVEINNQSFNLGSVVTEGFDFEISQIVDTAMFGHGDFGTFTGTVNGTYVTRFVFQTAPQGDGRSSNKEFNLAGDFADFGSIPHWRAYANLYWNGPKATWMQGLELGTTVHYTSQYSELDQDPPHAIIRRKIREWTPFDLSASYTFNLPPPAPAGEVAGLSKDGGKSVRMKDGKEKNVMPVSTAEYNPCGYRAWLNGTSIALGMNNVMDLSPPFVANSFENGYDEAAADVKGRFWYLSLTKKF